MSERLTAEDTLQVRSDIGYADALGKEKVAVDRTVLFRVLLAAEEILAMHARWAEGEPYANSENQRLRQIVRDFWEWQQTVPDLLPDGLADKVRELGAWRF